MAGETRVGKDSGTILVVDDLEAVLRLMFDILSAEGYRVVKARDARPAPTAAEVLALDSQIARVRAARAGSGRSGGAARPTRRAAAGESRTKRPSSQSTRDTAPRPPVDLDTASAVTLEALPWIGPALAARIIESRERCGPFGSLDALKRVYGIGDGMAKRLAPHVTFSTSSRPIGAERTAACSTSARAPRPAGEAGREDTGPKPRGAAPSRAACDAAAPQLFLASHRNGKHCRRDARAHHSAPAQRGPRVP